MSLHSYSGGGVISHCNVCPPPASVSFTSTVIYKKTVGTTHFTNMARGWPVNRSLSNSPEHEKRFIISGFDIHLQHQHVAHGCPKPNRWHMDIYIPFVRFWKPLAILPRGINLQAVQSVTGAWICSGLRDWHGAKSKWASDSINYFGTPFMKGYAYRGTHEALSSWVYAPFWSGNSAHMSDIVDPSIITLVLDWVPTIINLKRMRH